MLLFKQQPTHRPVHLAQQVRRVRLRQQFDGGSQPLWIRPCDGHVELLGWESKRAVFGVELRQYPEEASVVNSVLALRIRQENFGGQPGRTAKLTHEVDGAC